MKLISTYIGAPYCNSMTSIYTENVFKLFYHLMSNLQVKLLEAFDNNANQSSTLNIIEILCDVHSNGYFYYDYSHPAFFKHSVLHHIKIELIIDECQTGRTLVSAKLLRLDDRFNEGRMSVTSITQLSSTDMTALRFLALNVEQQLKTMLDSAPNEIQSLNANILAVTPQMIQMVTENNHENARLIAVNISTKSAEIERLSKLLPFAGKMICSTNSKSLDPDLIHAINLRESLNQQLTQALNKGDTQKAAKLTETIIGLNTKIANAMESSNAVERLPAMPAYSCRSLAPPSDSQTVASAASSANALTHSPDADRPLSFTTR